LRLDAASLCPGARQRQCAGCQHRPAIDRNHHFLLFPRFSTTYLDPQHPSGNSAFIKHPQDY
jgi:hypothetical protein